MKSREIDDTGHCIKLSMKHVTCEINVLSFQYFDQNMFSVYLRIKIACNPELCGRAPMLTCLGATMSTDHNLS